jgi:hypothetical protein
MIFCVTIPRSLVGEKYIAILFFKAEDISIQ